MLVYYILADYNIILGYLRLCTILVYYVLTDLHVNTIF